LVLCESVRPVEAIATGAPFSGGLAADRDAGDAVEGLGDVGVGEFADVFCEDRVAEAGRIAFCVGRAREALAIAFDDDVVLAVLLGGLGRGGLDRLGRGRAAGALGKRWPGSARQQQRANGHETTSRNRI
jgi:hypothetical protein